MSSFTSVFIPEREINSCTASQHVANLILYFLPLQPVLAFPWKNREIFLERSDVRSR